MFDSEDGAPVSGATVTLVDAQTGAPAAVRADDGRTSWPSSVVTGQDVIDGAGNVWPMPDGEYRFTLVPLGHYRLAVFPPAGYTAPSKVSSASLAALRRPDGAELEILPASFGNPLELASLAPVRVDIPLDRPARAVDVTKSASRDVVQPGDKVFFRVRVRNADQARDKTGLKLVDRTSPQLRLLSDSVRVGGALPAAGALLSDSDGRGFALTLGALRPGEEQLATYAMMVRPDAAARSASNRAQVADSRDLFSGFAVASVRIERDALAATMTLIGRATLGGCDALRKRQGLPGVRITLEDGSFAVSDASGRFHFEGLGPGTHVGELQAGTLPEGARVVGCARSTRSAGSALSRFVAGQGGGARPVSTTPLSWLQATTMRCWPRPALPGRRRKLGVQLKELKSIGLPWATDRPSSCFRKPTITLVHRPSALYTTSGRRAGRSARRWRSCGQAGFRRCPDLT